MSTTCCSHAPRSCWPRWPRWSAAGHVSLHGWTLPRGSTHCTALVPTMSAPAALPPARPPVGAEVAAEPAQAVGKQGLGVGSAFSSISGSGLCSSLINDKVSIETLQR